ncbi:MAG TPA: DUF1254 domain-containing protein [Aestuariivirgaceae bacterium]
MRRRLFWIAAILLLGLSVHLAYVLFVPNMEMSRIMKAAAENHGANRFLVLDEQEAAAILSQQSRAFVQGICVLDLSSGPVLVTLDTPSSYWMANVYSRKGDNIYSLNDRQVSEVPFSIVVERKKTSLFSLESAETPPEDAAFRVLTGDRGGLFVVRVFVQDPAYRARITRTLERSSCKAQTAKAAQGVAQTP